MPTQVPPMGLGTSRIDNPTQTVQTALDIGYRHVDAAQEYENLDPIGDALEETTVPREDLFVALKVREENLAYDDVHSTVEESFDKLGVEYVDMLSVHWPMDTYEASDTLPAFDELHDAGKARDIGVSNFSVDLLEEARGILDAPIIANQIEIHPMLPPRQDMVEYSQRHDIDLVAYSPLCRGQALDLPEVQAVADKHDVSAARAILAWLLAKDLRIIPKASSADHLRDNYAALELELDDEDVDRIDSVDRRKRRADYPDAPWNQ